jgi:hypothetical protein
LVAGDSGRFATVFREKGPHRKGQASFLIFKGRFWMAVARAEGGKNKMNVKNVVPRRRMEKI